MTVIKDVIYILDVSGSMAERGKLEMLNEAMDQIGELLLHPPEMNTVELKVSIYTFSGSDRITDEKSDMFNVLTPIILSKSPESVLELWKMKRITEAYGGTPLSRAIVNVAQALDKQEKMLQMCYCNQAAASIILLSDGQPTTEVNCGGRWMWDTEENVKTAIKRACEISQSFKSGLCGVVAFDIDQNSQAESILRKFVHASNSIGEDELFFRAGNNLDSLKNAIWSATIGTISNR